MFSLKARQCNKARACGKIAVCAVLALMSLAALARARDEGGGFHGDQPAPPPEPNAMDIEVPRGGPVWITLSAYSLTSPIIRYRIRRLPTAGKIGTPQMVTADTAAVKYKPPEGVGPGEDSFSFQVQSMAGVSVAAEVRIRVTDKAPVLVAPDELDFGEVLPGQSARRELVLQNIGGGLAQGSVSVPEGWTVEGDPAYRVAAGAKQSFTIVFAPREQREYLGDISYTGNLERATDLKGKEAESVNTAVPKKIEPSRVANAPAIVPPNTPIPPGIASAGSPMKTAQAAAAPASAQDGAALAVAGLPALVPDEANPAPADAGTPISPLKVDRVGEDGARVTSNFQGGEPARTYRLEVQSVKLDAQGKLQAQWLPFPGATVKVNGPGVSAELAHLERNALFVVRIVGLDKEGGVVALSAPGQIWTVRTKAGGRRGWIALGVGLLAVAGAWIWRKRAAG